jgi:tetratricopeptide (TPR) repeat protein
MTSFNRQLAEAVEATKDEDYLRALTLFLEAYGSPDAPTMQSTKSAEGLSYFGLCLALVRKQYKEAIDLCRRAIDLEFYNGAHYANLARVYLASGSRRRALEMVEAGLKIYPDDEALMAARAHIGVRAKPSVPFLDRSHPINVTLGQARHAKKVSEGESRRKRQPRDR